MGQAHEGEANLGAGDCQECSSGDTVPYWTVLRWLNVNVEIVSYSFWQTMPLVRCLFKQLIAIPNESCSSLVYSRAQVETYLQRNWTVSAILETHVVSASAVSCFNVPYSHNLCQLYLYIGLKNFSMFRSYSFRYVPVHSSTCFNVLTKSTLIVFVICYGYIALNNFSPFRSLVSSLCSLYSSTSNNNNNYQKAHADPHKT